MSAWNRAFDRESRRDRALPDSDVLCTVEEVARTYRSPRGWRPVSCRRVEHVHLVRARRFTRSQVDLLVSIHTIKPEDHKKLDATRQRLLRRFARAPRRRPPSI